MELILTMLVVSVSIVNAAILIFWALTAKRIPTKNMYYRVLSHSLLVLHWSHWHGTC